MPFVVILACVAPSDGDTPGAPTDTGDVPITGGSEADVLFEPGVLHEL